MIRGGVCEVAVIAPRFGCSAVRSIYDPYADVSGSSGEGGGERNLLNRQFLARSFQRHFYFPARLPKCSECSTWNIGILRNIATLKKEVCRGLFLLE